MSPVYIYEVYNESSHISDYTRYSEERRISAIVHNTTSSPATYTINYSTTQSMSANISLTGTHKGVVSGTVGFNIAESFTGGTSIQMSISPGYYGWMKYTPIVYNTWGYIKHEQSYDYGMTWHLVHDTFVDIYSAKEMAGGMPDGYYTLMESDTEPL